jgi:hypothetical protein
MKLWFVIVIFVLSGCNTSRLVDSWKSPKIDERDIKKVLVVGLTSNMEARKMFEKKLKSAFFAEDVQAISSMEKFGSFFNNNEQSEKDLDKLEKELIKEKFDAVLITKVKEVEEKVSVGQAYQNFSKDFKNFKDDYLSNQDIYSNQEKTEKYKVYHTESTFYALSNKNKRELLWRGSIDLNNPQKMKRSVNCYVRTVITSLKEENIITQRD